MATIRPLDLPAAASVSTTDVLIVDKGSAVERATPAQVVDAAIPLASQAEAETGTDNEKRVTPLRVKQAIDALGVSPTALAATGAGEGSSLVGFKQEGVGAVDRTAEAKLRDIVSVKDFGAAGDGTTDDTAAILAAIDALPSGGTLHLSNGKTYRLTASLVLEKPVRIVGGAQEQNKLLFDAAGTYSDIGDGTKAAIIIMHSQTVLTGYSGDARRTKFEGLTVEAGAGMAGTVRGIVICAPAYFSEARVASFPSDGFAVMAGAGSPIDGIANGCTFQNCASYANGRHGYYFLGNDSNACLISRSFAADCGAWGFYDDSLLGNTYIQCEADGNATGGYFATDVKPNASTYLSCYSETPTHFDVGPLCQLWGAQGLFKPARSSGGIVFRGLPSGAAYCTQPIRIATTDDIAEATGESPNTGPCAVIAETGFDFKVQHPGLHVKLNGLLSANYTTFYNGADPVASFPNSAFTGNINPKRFHLHDGMTLGASGKSGIVGAGAAAPTTGAYDQGAIWLNDAPVAGGKIGWVCVTGGSPGVWKPWGAIDV